SPSSPTSTRVPFTQNSASTNPGTAPTTSPSSTRCRSSTAAPVTPPANRGRPATRPSSVPPRPSPRTSSFCPFRTSPPLHTPRSPPPTPRRRVPWTKPEDLPLDTALPLNGLGSHHGYHNNGFNVLMADGSIRFLKSSITPSVLGALLTRNGNEVVSPE